jgi:hypothetical protein
MNPKKNSIPIIHSGGKSGLGHMLKIEVNVSGKETFFIFDTGIGVNLISKSLCADLGCKITGSTTGKRMTGQELTVPMSKVESLKVANVQSTRVDTGVWDFKQLLPNTPEFNKVQGYLSLNFFDKQPFTIDYTKNLLIIEDDESLNERIKQGTTVPISKRYQGSALTIHVPVKSPINKTLDMQLDLGTDILTISDKYLGDFKPYFDKTTVKTQSIKDETGFNRNRVFVKLNGDVGLLSKNLRSQKGPKVMFQRIIYDGIIGNNFFKDRVVTYDLKNSRLIIDIEK